VIFEITKETVRKYNDDQIIEEKVYGSRKDIDWKKVDNMLVAGCKGPEIAGEFGIHADTLYLNIEKNME